MLKFDILFPSSASSSSDDDTEDEMSSSSRGRSTSLTPTTNGTTKPTGGATLRQRDGSSGDSAGSTPNLVPNGLSIRSRSPISLRQPTNLLASKHRRHDSPLNTRVAKQKGLFESITILPAFVDLRIRVPLTAWVYTFNVELRKLGESVLLLGTLAYATKYFGSFPEPDFFPEAMFDVRYWLTAGE
jgi:hypothetical protein